jgi:hypothetical protein
MDGRDGRSFFLSCHCKTLNYCKTSSNALICSYILSYLLFTKNLL